MDDPGTSVAVGADALTETPDWTRIDDPDGIRVVNGWSTRRGRELLTDRNEAGTLNIGTIDRTGILDLTNTGSDFYPMNPNYPVQQSLYNPVTALWRTVFRGFAQGAPQTVRIGGAPANSGTIPVVDLFSILARKEVPPGLSYPETPTDPSTSSTVGETVYANQTVQDRLDTLRLDVGIPDGLVNFFSGNVRLQQTVYDPGYSILSAMQDAADGEFPGVANLFVSKYGILSFRGRLSRFDSGEGNPYGIHTWHVGDSTAVAGNPGMAVLAADDVVIDRGLDKVYNSAHFMPQGIADADIPGQLSFDQPSIDIYGDCPLSAQELLTYGSTTGANIGDPLAETKIFSDFYVNNFKDAQTTIARATFRARHPDRANAETHWNFLCNIDIGDVIEITMTLPSGSRLIAERYFVEGISYRWLPGGLVPNIVMVLDLSPGFYYTNTPPPGWDPAA